jgi:hypothetical protein
MFAPRYPTLRLLFLLGPLLAVSDTALADDPADRKVELKKGDRIIFFGDSRIVRGALNEAHKDKNIEVDCVATGGHTVPDLLKRVDSPRSRRSSSLDYELPGQ